MPDERKERVAGRDFWSGHLHGQDVVVVSHGGTIRAALGHALGVGPDAALHFSVHNISLTRIERHQRGWSVVCVNEMVGL